MMVGREAKFGLVIMYFRLALLEDHSLSMMSRGATRSPSFASSRSSNLAEEAQGFHWHCSRSLGNPNARKNG